MKRLTYTLALLLLFLAACTASAPPEATEINVPAPTAIPPTPVVEVVESEAADNAPQTDIRTFTIDSTQSAASYIVDETFLESALEKLGINAGEEEIVGTSNGVSGIIGFDFNSMALSGDNTISVDLTQLQTGESRRDGWVQDKGPSFGSFPTATFTAKNISGAPASFSDGETVTFQLIGDLAIRDTVREVTFDVTASVAGNVLTGTAVANTILTDFGITPPDFAKTLIVQDPFRIEVNLVAVSE